MVLGEFEGVGLNFEENVMVQDNGIVFTFKGITNWRPQLWEAQCDASGHYQLVAPAMGSSMRCRWSFLVRGWDIQTTP
jgi:hypothetical protein